MKNRKKIILLIALFLSFTLVIQAQNTVSLIPYPNQIELKKGTTNLSGGVSIAGNSSETAYLGKVLTEDFKIPVEEKKKIKISLNREEGFSADSEAYHMSIRKNKIDITAASDVGIFYGIQNLRQLLLKDKKLPHLEIKDAPRFHWRSYMLDVARNFQTLETTKKILDDMALLKLNRFHWHLTNDQGWRIEIKHYPLLTEIGSKRDSTQINVDGKKWESNQFDGKPQEGFYTQEEIKDIIAYAQERHIMIIPEISMPGHIAAAIASYPLLGVTKEKIRVPPRFGVVEDVLDVSDPGALHFIQTVLTEVADLFPSPYIHLGGDEVKFNQWRNSSDINAYMKKNNIDNYFDLQVDFTNKVADFVSEELHKNIIGWNEVLGISVHDYQNEENSTVDLSKEAIIQFWAGKEDIAKEAVKRGYRIINSDNTKTYIDYTYEQIGLRKAYDFDPVIEGMTKKEGESVLGLGTQMWGEWTPTHKEIEFQTYPRIAAYAEDGWTQLENKNYDRFLSHTEDLMEYWKSKGYHLPTLEEYNK